MHAGFCFSNTRGHARRIEAMLPLPCQRGALTFKAPINCYQLGFRDSRVVHYTIFPVPSPFCCACIYFYGFVSNEVSPTCTRRGHLLFVTVVTAPTLRGSMSLRNRLPAKRM